MSERYEREWMLIECELGDPPVFRYCAKVPGMNARACSKPEGCPAIKVVPKARLAESEARATLFEREWNDAVDRNAALHAKAEKLIEAIRTHRDTIDEATRSGNWSKDRDDLDSDLYNVLFRAEHPSTNAQD